MNESMANDMSHQHTDCDPKSYSRISICPDNNVLLQIRSHIPLLDKSSMFQ